MKFEKIYKNANYRVLCFHLEIAKIHMFTGLVPIGVNSFIIETANNLVIIDTQISLENAKQLKIYANSLNKNLVRIILTHAHYDHYVGLPVFNHELTYALQDTIADMGKLSLNADSIPCHALAESFVIDGLTYKCNNFKNAHCPNHLVLYIEEINTLVVGDLAQENTHLLAMNFYGFIHALTSIQQKYTKAKYILTGHGKVTSLATIDANLIYMKKCLEIYTNAKNNEEFHKKVLEEFPNVAKINPPLYYLFRGKPNINLGH